MPTMRMMSCFAWFLLALKDVHTVSGECIDTTTLDNNGESCAYYNHKHNAVECLDRSYDDDDFTAATMCCGCQGEAHETEGEEHAADERRAAARDGEAVFCLTQNDCPREIPYCFDGDEGRVIDWNENFALEDQEMCSENSTCFCTDNASGASEGGLWACHRGDGCVELDGGCYDIESAVVLDDMETCPWNSQCLCMTLPATTKTSTTTYAVGNTISGSMSMTVIDPEFFASDVEVTQAITELIAGVAAVPKGFVHVNVNVSVRRLSESDSRRALASTSNIRVYFSVKIPVKIEASMGVTGTVTTSSVSQRLGALDAARVRELLPSVLVLDYGLSVDAVSQLEVSDSSGRKITTTFTTTTRTTTSRTTTTKTTTYFKAAAVVTGNLQLTSSDPEATCQSPEFKEAMTTTIAEAAGVDEQYVEVTLRVGNRRLEAGSGPSPRRLAGSVLVTYAITLPVDTPSSEGNNTGPGSVSITTISAEAVQSRLAAVTPVQLTEWVLDNLAQVLEEKGIDPADFALTVTVDNIEAPTIEDPPTTTLESTTGRGSAQSEEPRVAQVHIAATGACVLATFIIGV